MSKKFIVRIMLVISIVLQSFFTIASQAEVHQVDIEHIQSEHSHADDKKLQQVANDNEGHEIADCHHCDHCSGTHFSWMFAENLSNSFIFSSVIFIPFQKVFPKDIFETSFIPPIA